MVRKLTLSFNVNPSAVVCCNAQGLSHATNIAKAKAAAATCRIGEPVLESDEAVANIKVHDLPIEDAAEVAGEVLEQSGGREGVARRPRRKLDRPAHGAQPSGAIMLSAQLKSMRQTYGALANNNAREGGHCCCGSGGAGSLKDA